MSAVSSLKYCAVALLTPASSRLVDRVLGDNRLTSLGVGLFDKNTALSSLYVDQAESSVERTLGSKATPRTVQENDIRQSVRSSVLTPIGGAGHCESIRGYEKSLRQCLWAQCNLILLVSAIPFFSDPSLVNRSLSDNQLTSLEVGLFDKNTALTQLYVDQAESSAVKRSRKEWDMCVSWRVSSKQRK